VERKKACWSPVNLLYPSSVSRKHVSLPYRCLFFGWGGGEGGVLFFREGGDSLPNVSGGGGKRRSPTTRSRRSVHFFREKGEMPSLYTRRGKGRRDARFPGRGKRGKLSVSLRNYLSRGRRKGNGQPFLAAARKGGEGFTRWFNSLGGGRGGDARLV